MPSVLVFSFAIPLRLISLCIALNILFLPSFTLAGEYSQKRPLKLVYPVVTNNNVSNFNVYFLKQLRSAMDKTGVPYEMDVYTTPMFVESRSHYYLSKNRYNVHWLHTNAERESDLLPIKVPLFKGLIGWRLFLISEGQQRRFTRIREVNQLKKLIAGQGHDWPDTRILKQNGFEVEVSMKWESLFKMLSLHRTDYFPRSIVEIDREKRIFSDLNLEVEQTLALHYPAAYYFFVSKEHPELAEVIYRGLMLSVEDGTFDRHFNEHFGEFIQRANLNGRRVFELKNSDLSFPTDPRFWYRP